MNFFMESKYKLWLFYKLYEKRKIQKNEEEYYEKIINLLNVIKKDITKSKLEKFSTIEPSKIIQRLSLIELILKGLNPDDQYAQLKKEIMK